MKLPTAKQIAAWLETKSAAKCNAIVAGSGVAIYLASTTDFSFYRFSWWHLIAGPFAYALMTACVFAFIYMAAFPALYIWMSTKRYPWYVRIVLAPAIIVVVALMEGVRP